MENKKDLEKTLDYYHSLKDRVNESEWVEIKKLIDDLEKQLK